MRRLVLVLRMRVVAEPRNAELPVAGGFMTMDEYQAILQRANRRYMGEIALDAADDVLVLLDVVGKMNLRLQETEALATKVAAAEQIVTLAYRGAQCVRPVYNVVQTNLSTSSTRQNCGECWGCQLAKAAAEYRGLK